MCMMCKKDGSCCKNHMVMKGVALLIVAAAFFAIDRGYLNISYAMLIAVVLGLMGLKKVIMAAMWKDEAPKKKGRK